MNSLPSQTELFNNVAPAIELGKHCLPNSETESGEKATQCMANSEIAPDEKATQCVANSENTSDEKATQCVANLQLTKNQVLYSLLVTLLSRGCRCLYLSISGRQRRIPEKSFLPILQ